MGAVSEEFCALLPMKNISFFPPKNWITPSFDRDKQSIMQWSFPVSLPTKIYLCKGGSNHVLINILITAIFTSLFPSSNAYVQCSSTNA